MNRWQAGFIHFFKKRLYDYQLKIVESILEKKHKRVVITASTRAGKSYCIAMITLFYALLNSEKKIFIIAPGMKQASVIMGYIFDFITRNEFILQQTLIDVKDRQEKLGKKMTIDTITMKNETTITILSAEGKGERLLGFGGDLIIVDESPLIDDTTFDTKIMRMLGESKDAQLIEIGNPIKNNHFYKHWCDDKYVKIHIHWSECVKEGRLTKEFIEEMRTTLTDRDFKTLYDAVFVTEQGLFFKRDEEIMPSIIDCEKPMEAIFDSFIQIGIDFGRKNDYTSIAVFEKIGEILYLRHLRTIKDMSMPNQRMTLERLFDDLIENGNVWEARLDMTGMGLGITEELQRKYGAKIRGINFAGKLHSKLISGNMAKVKVIERLAYNLKQMFNDRTVKLFNHNKLINELLSLDDELKMEGYEDGHFDRFVSVGLACLPMGFHNATPITDLVTNKHMRIDVSKLKPFEVEVEWSD